MKDVFFSIIIPCYNQAHFLKKCLDSIANQTFRHWEAIVVNDGSTDMTKEISSEYQYRDSRFKAIYKPNGGLSSARNCGITHAKGQLLLFLDSDDFLYPGCLQILKEEIDVSAKKTLIQFGYSYVNEAGTDVFYNVVPKARKSLLPDVLSMNLGPCHSFCVTRELIVSAGQFDETLKSVEDWDFWIRIAKTGAALKVIGQPLVYYRYVDNSMSRNPFVMYESLKEVASRAKAIDHRIKGDFPENRAYNEIDSNSSLLRSLNLCLGVSVMQGKIQSSVDLFRMETKRMSVKCSPEDFRTMCSYLTFRYKTSDNEINSLIKDTLPHFKTFFKQIRMNLFMQYICLYAVFSNHIQIRNVRKYGLLGSVANAFMRFLFKIFG